MIIAATNKDCQTEIEHGRLRKDFFYRIGIIEINVPPLRERKEDLPLLIEHLLEQYYLKHPLPPDRNKAGMALDASVLPAEFMQALYAYDWPGNVRELQNILQRYLATNDVMAVLERIPGWAIAPRLSVNGQPATAVEIVNNFATLKRTWQNQDVVTLILPMNTQIVESDGYVGIRRGPLLYALPYYQRLEKYHRSRTLLGLGNLSAKRLELRHRCPGKRQARCHRDRTRRTSCLYQRRTAD
ncbi:sigma54 specific transcriptional regulator, Fis family [Candidatus Moduliflexus flocculans]|uniref:Sigma54 specific transcriptional regulator, Fis family n=1 Tax=Candidatus Moduliflexus flocculans TaxID=1499966 RepID=A0A081BR02_9BACT|nr:sigma54 specific transcriptional regulator, Fis family [Candidatus Moduliflexus flocculans]